ncbi:FtsK/SpoIIIE domain-containing protein [Streptomyces sp. ST2-7A]|uniref:FtsK/SpoIIIE domain-containing protein n=1 Tax=Streptomyces sp. ST2-7A TaxID=2907214 RepID=UPI001F4688E9|nr:FtsK/SpoIIIE domain-containing protein [Streptomyces sp. ST2-7A]MCE7083489.1 hypothetical protein [Streptomyces sp. ST2-7A]
MGVNAAGRGPAAGRPRTPDAARTAHLRPPAAPPRPTGRANGTTPLDTTVKLTVTTAEPSGRRTDHLLDVPEGATVGDLLPALVRAPDPGEADDAPATGVSTTPAGTTGEAAPIGLYHGADRLDPDLPLSACGVREGALLGLGAPLPEESEPGRPVRFPPPGDPTLVELRHVSGPGAGRVWRLGPGRHEWGTDRGCALRPDGDPGAGVPDSGVWITVGVDGSVSVLLPGDADPERCGLRSLTPPPPVDPDTGIPLTDEEPAGPRDGGPGGHSPEPPAPGPDGLPEPPPTPPPAELPRPTDGSVEWPEWADLALGDHLLRHCAPFEPDAAVNPSADGVATEYNRPPRLAPHLDDESLRLPGPPTAPRGRAFPFLMIIMPLIMGMVLISLFRNFFFVIFVFFTPLMAISNWVMARRGGRRQHAEKLRLYRIRRTSLEREMRRATITERGLRNRAFPDPAAVLLTASGPGGQLWERRRRDPDHLVLRLGTVTRASLKRIEDQARDSNHRTVHWRLADVPYGVEMTECGVIGFTGQGDGPRALARWAVAQSAVLHSPRDLRIVVLTTDEHADSWSWVRWLPHLRGIAPQAVVALGNDPESTAHRVNELLSRLRARVQASSSALARTLMTEPDILVVLDGARRLRDVPGVVELLTTGPAVRIFSLCLDERERLLPEECTVVVSAAGSRLTLRASGIPAVEEIRADLVTPDWCERVARSVAPVRDVSVDADSGLPADVRLLPLLDQEPPDPAKLVELWNRRPASTSFTLGRGYENLLRLDLVRDGPHGLVGGTTGSGKSELLQTLIASLAAVNRPDELTFVLVDYKGGSAFRECAELPHTLGMITDLDGHLVQRALASLDAELRRRETVLAEVEAKDHAEYRAKRARDPRLAPLPRLLIVIDEFATLVRELPGFVPGLINLAQRGRSLGLHLLLATQRPAGSVNNEIKANTNLRIALRVTDRAESQDIIDSPDAVTISPHTPGRALVRRGGGTPTAFQTAWVGAERPGAVAEEDGTDDTRPAGPARPVRAAELTWQGLGRPVVTGEEEDEGETVTEERPTDLGALVSALRQAADLLPDLAPGVRPWLPALPEHLTLRDLPPTPPTPPAPPGRLPAVPYALYDVPQRQERRLGVIDFAEFGHLYVIGTPRSGRTQVLRTVAGSIARTLTSEQVHLYCVDSSGGGLAALSGLPHCGAVVSRHDTERLERLLQRLSKELTRRQRLLSEHDCASWTELRGKLSRARRPAHLMLLIDGWDSLSGLLDDYDGGRLYGEVVRLLREGAAVGVHVIATSERLLLAGRLGAHNDKRLLLRQAEAGDYFHVGLSRDRLPSHVPEGRAWHAPSGLETQVALLPGADDDTADTKDTGDTGDTADTRGARGGSGTGSVPDQADALRRIAREAAKRDSGVPADRRPFPIAELPGSLTFQQAAERLPGESGRPLWALVGLGGDDAGPIGFDFAAEGGAFVVAGPPRSGRSTALASMAVSLLMGGTSLVVLAPRESQLRRLAAHDLARVLTDADPSAVDVEAALEATGGRPTVLIVDDAELLANCAADKVLRRVLASGRDRGQGLLVAATAESTSALGWLGQMRRVRRGLLTSPKSVVEGELIGCRMSSEQVRMALPPGRGWTAGPSGGPMAVQVPLTVLGEG